LLGYFALHFVCCVICCEHLFIFDCVCFRDNFRNKNKVKEIGTPFPEAIEHLHSAGLKAHGDNLYVVYGVIKFKGHKYERDSSKIFCYNIVTGIWTELEARDNQTNFPRHNVNVCYVEKKSKAYLYIMGGEPLADNEVSDRYYDIFNLIEVIEIVSLVECKFEKLDKSELKGQNFLTYLPLIYSYSHYDKEKNVIKIMGGRVCKGSVNEWSFYVFDLNVTQNKLTDAQHFINKISLPEPTLKEEEPKSPPDSKDMKEEEKKKEQKS